jgi:hypothetical protein
MIARGMSMKEGKSFHHMQVKEIPDRRTFYEGVLKLTGQPRHF